MRYRVAFAKRFQSDGNESALDPTADMDIEIPDGVVADKVFVGRLEPESQHGQDVLDEDDAWLGLAAAELWEYDVVDGREQDFVDAMQNSEVVMEFSPLDDTTVDAEDATGVALSDSSTKAPDAVNDTEEVTVGGAGARGTDDGPAGQVTTDASANGMGPGRPYLSSEEMSEESSGEIEDVAILPGDDPTLGLTDYNEAGPEDWAADTGPTRSAEGSMRKAHGR